MGTAFGKIRNKKCCCGVSCCGRCLPLNCLTGDPIECDNPLPLELAIDITATPSVGSSTCFNGSGTLTFTTPLDGGLCCWQGTLTGTCIDCNGIPFDWELLVVVCCSPENWTVSGTAGGPCSGPGTETIVPTTCDPVLLSGCWAIPVSACFVCFDPPEYTICFEIYEVP
jgi:hypothetical protein